MKGRDVKLWDLYLSFFRIGGLTFGGGYAMLPMLQREVITKHGWVTEEEVLDIYAIGQCTPGIIAVNTATMIGYRKRGIPGAIVATLGEVSPSLIIISILATVLLCAGYNLGPTGVWRDQGRRMRPHNPIGDHPRQEKPD